MALIFSESSANLPLVPIESIKELRFGSDTSYYRSLFDLPPETQSRWITIVYILEGAYKILHIIAPSMSAFQQWKESLNKLHAVRQGLMTGTYDNAIRDVVWEKQVIRSYNLSRIRLTSNSTGNWQTMMQITSWSLMTYNAYVAV